jgi:hypothetical protein
MRQRHPRLSPVPVHQQAGAQPTRAGRLAGVPRSAGRRGLRRAAGLAILTVLCATASRPRAAVDLEYDIKGAFLFNFAKFVEWPDGSVGSGASPIRLCILGRDPFGTGIDALVRDESVNGRPLQVERLDRAAEARVCHIVFLPAAERARMDDLLAATRGSSALTVSELPRFLERGGIINFDIESGKVRFEVNLAAAQRAELKISSKLLRVARVFHGPGAR